MRHRSPILLSLALLFACGCGYASAAESRHMSADGGGSCPETTATSNDHNDIGDTDAVTPAVVPVPRAEKTKTVAAPHSSGTRATAPRWQSFLPGMFR
ncbi:MAG: hypothetical protein ABIP16_07620 [Thermomonas sp.]